MFVVVRLLFFVAAALALASIAAPVSAAPVACGNIVLGTRTVTIDPGLVGGYCYGQNGNLQSADIAALAAGSLPGLTTIDKDDVSAAPDGALWFTLGTSTSGTWSFAQSLWDVYDRMFLGFHFGGGGDTADDNPDSFVVELAFDDFAGAFALGGGQLNGLSNIHLLGIRCTDPNGCHHPRLEVPEPGALALVMLALASLGLALRRRGRYQRS